MGLFRRRDSTPVPVFQGPPPVFEGVTLDEVRALGTGLYEVVSTSGVHVYLHDLAFVGLVYDSQQRTLVTRFLDYEPGTLGDAHRDTPLVVYAFEGVQTLQHEEELVEPGTPDYALGQVGGFDYDERTAIFALSTWTIFWVFRASRCRLTLEPLTSE